MKRNSWAIIAIVSIILSCCGSRHKLLDKRSLEGYIRQPKHGLIQEAEEEGIHVSLSVEPTGLLVAQEWGPSGKKDTAGLHKLEQKYGKNYYFLLKFSKNGKEAIRQLGSFARYSDMVQVLSFQMQQYVNITTPSHDTVQLNDYVFEQTYGMSNANTLLLSFPKDRMNKSERVEVNLAECGFGTGNLRFIFRKKDIDDIPELDYARLE